MLTATGARSWVANTAASGNRTRWTVWRYANGALVEQSGEHRTDLSRLADAEWLMRGQAHPRSEHNP
jgi:hypothetical protein